MKPNFAPLASLAAAALLGFAAQAQTVTTIAGSGSRADRDGTGLQASFFDPSGIAVDSRGTIWVVDGGAGSLRKMTPAGVVTTPLGSLRSPTSVAVDASDAVYVAEESFYSSGGGSDADVQRLTSDGQRTTYASLGAYVMTIGGLALDASGNLYVVDDGDFVDGGLGKILKVAPTGAVQTIAAWKDVSNPGYIAVDAAGNVYFTDTDALTSAANAGYVGKLTIDGKIEVLASGLRSPTGIALDAGGGILVAETANNRILRIASDGKVTTLAGSGVAGSTDGAAASATFKSPTGIALDGKGGLYVADSGNNLIRRVTLTGAACGAYCTGWTIPSVAHTAGAGGAFWTSDLVLHNRGGAPAAVTLKFLASSRDGTTGPERSFTLDPFQTVTYADVLASVFGIAGDAGALEVLTSSDQLAVRSRTFTASAGGTVGDGVPGVRWSAFFTDQTSPSPVLTGLTENDRFRSNVILVNGTAAPLDILASAIDSSGASIGSRTYTLPPLGMIQDPHFLIEAEFGSQPKTNVTVTLSSPTSGASYTASAVVIDNASNAPTTVLPQ